jgi:lactaldehyde dehydrogenase/glycolaldehyde dehydrogenase
VSTDIQEASLYVAGEWSTSTGDPIDVFDPTNERVIASVPSAGEADVEAALAAAAGAQPAWAATPAPRRGAYLREMADLVDANRPALAELVMQEVGKPLTQALGEVEFAAAFLRYNAEWDTRLEGEILPSETPGEVIHLLRAPVGVVVAICPWNFPLAVLCRKLGPALLTGNTVVIKPSEISPLSTLDLVRLIDERLDLPPGVINVVTGAGPTGEALVRSPRASLVSFTGHAETGKRVMAMAAGNLTRVSLELGGKAPAIVWRDADLELAVPAILKARHHNAGQVCTSAERVLVHGDIVDEFTERYVAAAQALVVGAPTDEVDMGPLVSAAQLSKTSAALATAVDEGATVVTGGGPPAGERFTRGYWYSPTVLRDVRPEMRVMHDETFGPVTPILAVDSLQQAIEIANDSRYGLAAYVFSRDYPTVMQTVDSLQCGEIYINRTLGESLHAHHAGFKESGIGGEDGKWGLLRYTQIKTAYHHYGTPAES